jgi:CxxC motif-containing protein (DUF1111 family)
MSGSRISLRQIGAVYLAALALGVAVASAQTSFPDGQALSEMRAGLSGRQLDLFAKGRGLFRAAWVIGPSLDHPDLVGVGPLYNRLSCGACHLKNGRGVAPGAGESLKSMVVRISPPGAGSHGEPLPHPVYGDQLNPDAIPGVEGEGVASFDYEPFEETLADGTRVAMRRPILSFRRLAYGPIGEGVAISVRNAPPIAGLGLLEEVAEADILALAATNGGRPNRVWDRARQTMTLGRFGLKANQPNLRQQVANAFVEDMGLTSSLFPNEGCTTAQTACLAHATRGAPELSEAQLDQTTAYVTLLAPPQRRGVDAANVAAGEAMFRRLGCASCHVETMKTARGEPFHPYTDLLLHDLGDGLADGRPDYAASGRDWRTPPLWGLGRVGRIGDGENLLHDGRAQSIPAAILWHGGEAQGAADGFRALAANEREALLAFLKSL